MAKQTAAQKAAEEAEKAKTEFIIIEHPDGRRVEVSRYAFGEFYEADGFTEAKAVPTEDPDGTPVTDIVNPTDPELREDPLSEAAVGQNEEEEEGE